MFKKRNDLICCVVVAWRARIGVTAEPPTLAQDALVRLPEENAAPFAGTAIHS